MKTAVVAPANREVVQHGQLRRPRRDHREPARLDDVDRADQQQPDQEQEAGGDQHHERDQLVLEVAGLLLDAPGVIHRRGNRAEHPHRGPDHQEAAGDAELDARLLQRVHLRRDELELPGEVAEDELEDRARGRPGSAVTLPRIENTSRKNGKSDSSA